VQPHAADALRAMNALRLLALLLPELKGIEALVVRDFYHRYTVDEHSFLAIEHLHRLKESKSEWDRRFAELLGELEQPELLYLALLLHDSGKAVYPAKITSNSACNSPTAAPSASISIRRTAKPCAIWWPAIWKCPPPCAATFLIPRM
jgi:tRNA nucleotidyltransferase/poly(A) polymerase